MIGTAMFYIFFYQDKLASIRYSLFSIAALV